MPEAHDATVEAMAMALQNNSCTCSLCDNDGGESGYFRLHAQWMLAALVRSEAVRAALVAAIRTHLTERISWHGPHGATSEEQWAMDTEKQFVRELQDGQLLAAILAALAPPEPA